MKVKSTMVRMQLLEQLRARQPRTIGIEGISGAGKSTFAQGLADALQGQVIPYDLFHRQERKDWNLHTDIKDFGNAGKISNVLERLHRGEECTLSHLYNHADGTFSRSYHFQPAPVLIVEGLNVMKLPLDFMIFLYVDPAVALVRGKDRDKRERNLTEQQWLIKKHIFHDEYAKLIPDYQRRADIVIDTTEHFPIVG